MLAVDDDWFDVGHICWWVVDFGCSANWELWCGCGL
jgi:hypothetical protein